MESSVKKALQIIEMKKIDEGEIPPISKCTHFSRHNHTKIKSVPIKQRRITAQTAI